MFCFEAFPSWEDFICSEESSCRSIFPKTSLDTSLFDQYFASKGEFSVVEGFGSPHGREVSLIFLQRLFQFTLQECLIIIDRNVLDLKSKPVCHNFLCSVYPEVLYSTMINLKHMSPDCVQVMMSANKVTTLLISVPNRQMSRLHSTEASNGSWMGS